MLDWNAQPDPFREFAGCTRVWLPLIAHRLATSLARIYAPDDLSPHPLSTDSIGMLMELFLELTAWKEHGPERWALRCNPSSGNLHPTEAYIFARGVLGLDDRLYHYLSRDHVLEQRCHHGKGATRRSSLWIGLAAVHCREAWKYGERTFRYCQLDIGHALGAIR